jgi:predicted dehydrogenase
MNILIIGSGRMGQRHATGIVDIEEISKIKIIDISRQALNTAMEVLPESKKFEFHLVEEVEEDLRYHVGIIASTARNRKESCELALKLGCKHLLIEKPLGQSQQEFDDLLRYFDGTDCLAYANLNMRVYPDSVKLKNDLQTMGQFEGVKNITINTGTVGIGANGIHYLDFLIFLSDADSASIIYAEIDEKTIPSARGNEFQDFGGRIFIEYYKNEKLVLNAFISISSESTVFGGWDIIGSNGRITINESTGKRIDYLRKADSTMPIQRYNADYLPPSEMNFDSPFLGDLTKIWVNGILSGVETLPTLKKASLSHKLMFDWLAKSKNFSNSFPIT